jgi:hypothetical protein
MKKMLKSKRRGSAIALAVVAIVILLAMGVGLLSLGFKGRIYSIRTASDIAARCAADAGLTMALFEMNEKLKVKPYSEGTLPQAIDVKLPYSEQVCSYKVTGNLGGGYVITSVGQSRQAKRAVRATIGLQGAFNHAILTKETLILKSGTVVDGYNSNDLTDKNVDVSIGSQSASESSVILNMGSTVNGDVFVAGGDIDKVIKDLGATVTGSKYISAQVPLPPVTAPTLADKPAIDVTGQTVKLTPADSGTYPEIYLRQTLVMDHKTIIDTVPSILEVSGGDVVLHLTGDIQLENSCEIVVKEGSSLTIYTDGNIHCRNGSSINMEAPPEQAETLQIYATGKDAQSLDIKAKSDFTGVIYAPDADVDIYAKGDAYGAIVANDFEYKAGGNFYYDAALSKKNTVDDEAVQFVVKRWYESPPSLSVSDLKIDSVALPVK